MCIDQKCVLTMLVEVPNEHILLVIQLHMHNSPY
jgi:hypothetical protein